MSKVTDTGGHGRVLVQIDGNPRSLFKDASGQFPGYEYRATAPKPSSTLPNPRKRAADEEPEPVEDDGFYHDNCDAIRRKINAFLRSGEMKVTHFQRFLNINSNSYGRFMKLKGPWSGADNQTFDAAYHFFRQREAQGKTIQKAKRAKTIQNAPEKDLAALKAIILPGEESGNVAIFDTCDEIRRKINLHIRKGETQASLARAFTDMFKDLDGRKITSAQVGTFLKKKGPREGNTTGLFYAAYVYFEKLRIKEGQKKSKTREEMEDVWGDKGFDTVHGSNVRYVTSSSHRPVMDKYGHIRCM